MAARSLLWKLAGLRVREKTLRLLWGLSRFVAVVVGVVLAACLLDWIIDRFTETPYAVHVLLLGTTFVAGLVAAYFWLARPLLRKLSDDTLSLWVEDRYPQLGHRLISTVQLNRKEAYREGMSAELIEVTSAQAEAQCKELSFTGVADHSRLGWALAVAVPIVALAAIPFLLNPELSRILFARHLLADEEIPRNIRIQSARENVVQPMNEDFALDYWVSARDGEMPEVDGRVIVTLANRYSDVYSLKPVHDANGNPHEDDKGRHLYRATISKASVNLSHTAQLGDGRSKPGKVEIVPRPTIAKLQAWNILPVEYVGLSPLGLPYMQPQSHGDIVGIPRSRGRVDAEIEKEIKKARIDLIGPEREKKDDEDSVPEVVKRTLTMDVGKRTRQDGTEVYFAKKEFDLRPEETSYRITVVDKYDLENVPPVTRRLLVKPEETPDVFLRKDYWTDRAAIDAPIDVYEREGIPVPVGEALRVPYVAFGPYGVGKAQFLFRILKKQESAADQPPDTPWIRLDLTPHTTDPDKDGEFDERRGVFENTKNTQSIEFYAVPADDPFKLPGTTAGGRYHFMTKKSVVGNQIVDLKEGDQIQYCIEVWPRHVDSKVDIKSRPVGKSETRIVTLGSYDDLKRWLKDTDDEFRRLKELEKKQGKVFGTQ